MVRELPGVPRIKKAQDVILERESLSEDELKRIIRSIHLKVTDQRLAILQTLHDGRRHVTAQELFEKINKAHPEIGFATVYRFLRTLSENNLVTEVRMGGLPARYELAPQSSHHDHLTCTSCGRICEFENSAIESAQLKVAKEFGFELTHHVLELYGICPGCQKAKKV